MKRLAMLVAVLLAFAAPKALRAQVGPAGGNGLCNGVVSAGNPCKPATAGTADSAKALTSAAYPLQAPNGTAVNPSYSFANQVGTGLYYTGSALGLAQAGSAVFACTTTLCNTAIAEFDINNAGDARLIRNGNANWQLDAGASTGVLLLHGSGNGRVLWGPNGTAAQPSLATQTDTGTGFYRFGLNTLGLSTAGVLATRWNAAQQALAINGTAVLPAWSFAADTISGVYRPAANQVGITAGGTRSATFTATTDTLLGTVVLGVMTPNTIAVTNVGTAAAPSITYVTGGTNTGLYEATSTSLGVTTNGVNAATFNADQTTTFAVRAKTGAGTAALPSWTFTADTISGILRPAANAVAITAGAKQVARFDSTSGAQLFGTSTNNNAAAGNVGEYVTDTRATGASLALTTATTLTVDSISLTAGDWDVSGVVAYTFGATTSYTNLTGGISSTTNVLGALGTNFDNEIAPNVPTAGADAVWVTPVVRVSQASTAYVYLVAQGTFTVSTLRGYGMIRARRVR